MWMLKAWQGCQMKNEFGSLVFAHFASNGNVLQKNTSRMPSVLMTSGNVQKQTQ